MIRPVLTMVRKELTQVVRDRTLLRLVVLVPIIQLFVLGYAAETDLRNVRVSVLDQDRSRESRTMADAFHRSDVFVPGPPAASGEGLEDLLRKGRTDVGLWIPVGYADDLAAGRTARVSIAVDGSNSSVAGRAVGYAGEIVWEEARERMEARARAYPQAALQMHAVEPVSRFFYNPELRSRHYMIPGIVVLLVTIISALLTGLAVVREREIGTLEQLMVSPLTPGQLLAGKTIPFAALAFLDLAIASVVAVLWFRLPFEGSVGVLVLASALYLLVTLGVGLLASTVSNTQQQAMFTMWFFLVFGIIMSGFFYPVENMPDEIRWLTYLNPVRYMMDMVRGIFLRGATIRDLAPDLASLGAIGLVTFSAAVLRFRKRMG